MITHYGDAPNAISDAVSTWVLVHWKPRYASTTLAGVASVARDPPPCVMTFLLVGALCLIGGFDLWDKLMQTLALTLLPLIQLTDLGIRQVDADLTEAAWSFGTSK